MSAKTAAAKPASTAEDFFLDGASLLRILGLDGLRTGAADGSGANARSTGAAASQPSAAIAAIGLVEAPGRREGDGALRIEAGPAESGETPAAVGVALGAGGGGIRLGELGAISFDYYLGDGAAATPAVRLVVDADGDLSTTGDRVQLVFEHAGQDGAAGSWQSADLAGGSWLGWQYADGRNLDGGADTVGLDRWASGEGYRPQGGYMLDANSLVLDCFLIVLVEEKPGVVFIDNLQIGAAVYDFTI